MRYNVGDTVVLNDQAMPMNARDVVRVDKIEKHWSGIYIYIYDGVFRFQFTDDMIDHDATDNYIMEQMLGETHKKNLWEEFSVSDEAREKMSFDMKYKPNSLSLTLEIKGAKEYRDKLEELHRQIETVEHTIEQLNEMEFKIGLKE